MCFQTCKLVLAPERNNQYSSVNSVYLFKLYINLCNFSEVFINYFSMCLFFISMGFRPKSQQPGKTIEKQHLLLVKSCQIAYI